MTPDRLNFCSRLRYRRWGAGLEVPRVWSGHAQKNLFEEINCGEVGGDFGVGSRKGVMSLMEWAVSEGGSEDDDGEVGMTAEIEED